jgi:hypothetical protein
MGGKVWSDGEEEEFWSKLARLAPPGFHQESKAVKKGRRNHEKSWQPLIKVMEALMREKYPGQALPRRYTSVSICELWKRIAPQSHEPRLLTR